MFVYDVYNLWAQYTVHKMCRYTYRESWIKLLIIDRTWAINHLIEP